MFYLRILRFLDSRFAGIAKGVGTSKIAGKIHSAPMTLGSTIFDCSFTVMENEDMPFLFGLDMLRKFQACINLKRNMLEIAGEEIPFLSENVFIIIILYFLFRILLKNSGVYLAILIQI